MKKHAYSRIIPTSSTTISLALGMQLQSGGIHFQISDFLGSQVVLTNLVTQEKKLANEYTLIQKIQSGEVTEISYQPGAETELSSLPSPIKKQINAALFSEAAIRDFVQKFKWVRALEGRGINRITDEAWIRAEMDSIGRHPEFQGLRPYKIATLATFQKLLQNCGGDYSKAIPAYSRRGGSGDSRLGLANDMLIDKAIKDKLDSGERIVKQHIIDKVTVQAQQLVADGKCIRVPSDSSISRRINSQISQFGILKSRNGRPAADKFFRDDGPRISAERPLEVAEWDDVDSGLFLIDEKVGLPFGRGYLTHGVDQCTLVPLGYDLSPYHRSTTSAINAVISGLMPKDPQIPAFQGNSSQWLGYGLAGINLFDNAVYNHTDEIINIQLNLKQQIDWVEPFHGAGKSAIEHFNDCLKNSFVCRLSGWRGDPDHPDYSKVGIKGAIYDRGAFERLYVHWVCNEYLNCPGDDGYTPAQRWNRFFSTQKPLVQWSREQIDFMRMRPASLTPRDSGGIKFLQLRYRSNELHDLIEHVGKNTKITAYYSESHLDYVIVRNPITKTLFRVPCDEDARYLQGLKPRHQRLILKQARKRKKRNPSLADCVKAREDLVAITESLRRDSRLRLRQKGYTSAVPEMPQSPQFGSTPPNTSEKAAKEVYMTDLECAINELDQIDVEDLDWGSEI